MHKNVLKDKKKVLNYRLKLYIFICECSFEQDDHIQK